MTSPPVISHAYTNFQFFSSLSLLSSPTIREEIRIHPNARLLSLIFFFFHYETDHRLTDFRGKRPPLFQEFERYNSSSPTWRPSRCLARVHAHTHARTSTSHVLATWKRDTDLSPTIELLREREKLGGRERGEDEKEGFEASRIEQI